MILWYPQIIFDLYVTILWASELHLHPHVGEHTGEEHIVDHFASRKLTDTVKIKLADGSQCDQSYQVSSE